MKQELSGLGWTIGSFPALYRDHHGVEPTTLRNDGYVLEMTVRGVTFQSRYLDDFDPVRPVDAERLSAFVLDSLGSLCAYSLEFDWPTPVLAGGETVRGILHVHSEIGEPSPDPRKSVASAVLRLSLAIGGETFASGTDSAFFDDHLFGIQHALPAGGYIKSCALCGLSGYMAGGSPAFGGLACFRGNKGGIRGARTTRDVTAIRDTISRFVQETYLCSEFERMDNL